MNMTSLLIALRDCATTPLHQRSLASGLRAATTATLLALSGWGSLAVAQPIPTHRPIAEIAYLVLLGELQVATEQIGAGYSLLLEAAKKSSDPELFQRTINVALASQSRTAATEAARVWATALPESPDPYKIQVQLLLAGNDIKQSAVPLTRLLAVVSDTDRNALIDVIAQTYSRTNQKAVAHQVATAALQPWLLRQETAASALAAHGVLALGLGNKKQALEFLRKAMSAPGDGTAAGMLAVELAKARVTEAESLLITYLKESVKNTPPVRMAYVRLLLKENRTAEALEQLEIAVTTQAGSTAEAWLLIGAIVLEKGQLDLAEEKFKRFLSLSNQIDPEKEQRGSTQAYLSLSQIAENRKNYAEAFIWLDKIDASENEILLQTRRAGLLSKQGKLAEARTLIRQIPEQQPTDARTKLLAEAQLLKDAQKIQEAFDMLATATKQHPDDEEVIYEYAMLAERMGQSEEMERVLRELMVRKPEYHHAYNALGYSLAERNTRLDEAKALIVKALDMAPGDPFITDSLGWVEYRLGNFSVASELLQHAFQQRPDIEIAMHLGEVLWMMGEREAAKNVFRRAIGIQADNIDLIEAIKRLGIDL